MKISVFGTGYVGLVQGAVLAEMGNHVVCVDVDSVKIENLRNGIIPIYEPGLEQVVKSNTDLGRLSFTTDASNAIEFADIHFIAVGTPQDEDGSADLSYVLKVAETMARNLASKDLIVIKSTVPVGTNAKVTDVFSSVLAETNQNHLMPSVVSNPEFLKEGSALQDCLKPDRIILGTHSDTAAEMLRTLYAPFNRNHDRIIQMDPLSAELTKYAANCMLATKISFINEIAGIAEELGADVEQVRKGIGADKRIGYDFIYPGLGYGGSCFPKDVQALISKASEIEFDACILKSVEERNKRQKKSLAQKILKHYQGNVDQKTFCLWGLSFKPGTDDIREAPSLEIIRTLEAEGAKFKIYDPVAAENGQRLHDHSDKRAYVEDMYEAAKGCHGIIIATEWKEFRSPDFELLKQLLLEPNIFDGRNLFTSKLIAEKGFTYMSVGRPPITP
ncbi:MAG: UDP-glucose dehydrogenase family protein [Alphaproteobacteria bacterium]